MKDNEINHGAKGLNAWWNSVKMEMFIDKMEKGELEVSWEIKKEQLFVFSITVRRSDVTEPKLGAALYALMLVCSKKSVDAEILWIKIDFE